MNKPPIWFTVVLVLALLWNIFGLFAVIADLRLTPEDIAALPPQHQALYAARPAWSVIATVVAVAGGTLGCIALLVRKKLALPLLYASLAGVVIQDIGIFIVAGAAKIADMLPFVLQGCILLIAVGLVFLAYKALGKSRLT